MGKGNKPNAAEAIDENQMEVIGKSGSVGTHSPRFLLRLVWWNDVVHLGMRAVSEHTGQNEHCKSARKYLPKLVKTDREERDPKHALDEYIRREPAGASKRFYLQPIENLKSEVWYKITTVGKETISSFMKKIKKPM